VEEFFWIFPSTQALKRVRGMQSREKKKKKSPRKETGGHPHSEKKRLKVIRESAGHSTTNSKRAPGVSNREKA